MADEFERIMAFFSMSPEEKELHLQDVFEDSVEYFERFKYTMVHGTPEEKKEAVQKVMVMKKRIEAETKKICERTGMSEEQLATYAKNPKNFSPDQWETIADAKKKLEEGVGEVRKSAGLPQEPGSDGNKKPKKRKKPKPKNWIQS